METRLLTQAAEIGATLALGVILGFLYDLLRVPRGIFPALSWIADLAFCLTAGLALFCLGMLCGGTLRFYMPFAALGGGLVWSALFGRALGPLLRQITEFGSKKRSAAAAGLKKAVKNLKNIFSSVKKRFRITMYTKNDKVGKSVSKSGARIARRGGVHHEKTHSGNTGKTYYPGGAGLRDIYDSGRHGEENGG